MGKIPIFRGDLRGSIHKSKSVGPLKIHILSPFYYMAFIEKLVFIQDMTHKALGTVNLFYYNVKFHNIVKIFNLFFANIQDIVMI